MNWMMFIAVRLEFPRVLLVLLFQRLVGPKEGVLRHIRRVAARLRCSPECFRHAADMVRSGTAANTEVANPGVVGLLGEVRDLVPGAGEWVECCRERAPAWRVRIGGVSQGLERRFLVVRPVGHR